MSSSGWPHCLFNIPITQGFSTALILLWNTLVLESWVPASGGGLVAKSCLALVTPINCRLPGSFVRGILQARVLAGVCFISLSRESYCWRVTSGELLLLLNETHFPGTVVGEKQDRPQQFLSCLTFHSLFHPAGQSLYSNFTYQFKTFLRNFSDSSEVSRGVACLASY